MAHNLAIINGIIAMGYQNETPWHKLGKRMGSSTDVASAMAVAQLAWNVALQPLYLGDGRKVEDRKAVVRDIDSVVLGTVGDQFRPIQNADAFGVLNEACRDHGVTIESAGALGKGERVWMLAKMPTTIEPTDGDTINGYFLLAQGHDGSLAYSARLTPIRVVCQNTLSAATSDSASLIAMRHTSSATDRVKQVHKLIGRLMESFKVTGDTFGTLARRRMSATEIAQYVEKCVPSPAGEEVSPTTRQRRDTIAKLVWAGKGAAMAGSDAGGSTAWAAYNAVVEYWDHVRPAEAQSFSAKRSANESAIFGLSAQLKMAALRAATQLVAV